MKCSTLIDTWEKLAPRSMAEEWDNVGLLVGDLDADIKSIYIALDATDEIIEEATKKNVDLLLTHHPLLYKPMKNITQGDFLGRRIRKLIKADINYYAMHTNFDVAVMADLAADYLKLENREILDKTDELHGLGKIGTLPYEMSLEELCNYIKDAFSLETVKVFKGKCNKFSKVVIMPGSGKNYIKNTIHSHADVMITGDIGHHEGIDAVADDITIIDAGHYGIEYIFVDYMKEFINSKFAGIEVYKEERKNPFQVM